jgi:curli production assembly/transport component CsgF
MATKQSQDQKMKRIIFGAAGLIGLTALSLSASASQLTYTPVNPTFGGNPLNGSYLLSTAQGQGFGSKSGNQGPSVDLSGLTNALSNIGSGVGTGTGTGTGAASNALIANPTALSRGMP